MATKVIGGKEATAEFCWDTLTDQRDPAIYDAVTDHLLAYAAEMAIKAGYPKPCMEAMRYVAEHCWKEGFIACLTTMEYGCIERVGVKMPQGGKEGNN